MTAGAGRAPSIRPAPCLSNHGSSRLPEYTRRVDGSSRVPLHRQTPDVARAAERREVGGGRPASPLHPERPRRTRSVGRKSMKGKDTPASLSGSVSLGGDVSVHRLGFGAMRLTGEGIWGPPRSRTEAVAVLRRAVELGVNFIDTADSYGPNVSEELIAEALFPYANGLVIATKGGWNRPGPNQWTHDATPAHLRKAVEGSLKRLRVERIDVYQLHTPDPVVPFDDSVGTLADLKNEGKIRLVALSNVTQEHIERARRIVPIVSVQNRYSFADREWDYVVDYCESNGIAFIPWFPLGAGRIAGEVLDQVARAHYSS